MPPDKMNIAFCSGRDVASVPMADELLLKYDIWTNLAHVKMLNHCGILKDSERRVLCEALVAPDENSLDCISARGEYEARAAATLSFLMNHLGTIAQDMILLSMPYYGMLVIPDRYVTGSSIMPQKKNPDFTLFVAEGKRAYWRAFRRLRGKDDCITDPRVAEGWQKNKGVSQPCAVGSKRMFPTGIASFGTGHGYPTPAGGRIFRTRPA